MQLNLGDSGSEATVGCEALTLLLGLTIISPVGALLITILGWIVTIQSLGSFDDCNGNSRLDWQVQAQRRLISSKVQTRESPLEVDLG